MNLSINSSNNSRPTQNLSFKAMKASQFKNLDYSCMRRFKAPIEKFNLIEDFHSWAQNKISSLTFTDLGGRNSLVQLKRKVDLQDWGDFLSKSQGLTAGGILLVLSSLLKGLESDNADLLPQINEDVFYRTINELKDKLKIDQEFKFDFKKIYLEKLCQSLVGLEDKWIIIPSKKNDEENFASNLEKLKTISLRTWCTKEDKAQEYLEKGDFHIYVKKGVPEIAIRLEDDTVFDIQGFKNDSKIPQEYLELIENYLKEKSFKLNCEALYQIESAQYLKTLIEKIRNEIGEAIDKNDVFKIMDYFGYFPQRLANGTISIAQFRQPRQANFSDLGIDENKLFEQISEIRGYSTFRNCAASSLRNIQTINGTANFADSAILDTGFLEEVGGDLYLSCSKIKAMPYLKKVTGTIISKNSLMDKQ